MAEARIRRDLQPTSNIDGGTVLIIDDDIALAKTLTDMLGLEGIHTVCLTAPQSLGDVTANALPDVILIDLMLAAVSGIEVAAELREGPFADIPRIAMSSSPFLLEIAAESGVFDHVLQKPLDYEILFEVISRYTEPDETIAGDA